MFELIIIPVIVAMITQAIKLASDGIRGNLTWQHLISDYGGMPSSHTAFVASLATVVGLYEGFNSAAFAVSFVLMIVVIRDAIGFRREIGRNSVLTNKIAKQVFKGNKVTYLPERIGHTIPQVIVGLALGSSLSVILFYLVFVL